MKPLKRFLIAFLGIILISLSINIQSVLAASFPGLETKIIAESSSSKIIKLQTFLQKLGLYGGKIDGIHSSILPSLLSYQKQTGLIVNNNDWGAGYFGVKTLTALQEDYLDNFNQYKYILEQNKPIEGERYFYVTAYYSAILGQDRYSYSSSLGRYRTYSEAIRMQGKGTNGASGKEVFPGMLAGPRNYDFGTKIELDGIGIGAIEDRGGAIVNAGERGFEHDRIDVWMGYGDEGRVRAEKWGVRKIKGKIVSSEREVNVVFNNSLVGLNQKLYVTPESKSIDVKKLQELFLELKLYNGNIDGKYISIKNELIDFQVNNSIIRSKNDDQAGYFGKKTIAVVKEKYSINDDIFKEPKVDIGDEFTALTRKEKLGIVKLKVRLNTYFEKQTKGNKVKITKQKTILQNKLQKVINKTSNKKKKQKLQYLKVLL